MARYYTAAEVAQELDVKKETVYTWLRTGQLRGEQVGFWWQVREEDLEAFRGTRAAQRPAEADARTHIFTPTSLARELHVLPGTLYRWLRTGTLRGRRVEGARWAINEEDLQSFLQTRPWLTDDTEQASGVRQ